MCLSSELEHNVENCVRVRKSLQKKVLEKIRDRVDELKKEIEKVIELSEYVEDIANSEGSIRSILHDLTVGENSSIVKVVVSRSESSQCMSYTNLQ